MRDVPLKQHLKRVFSGFASWSHFLDFTQDMDHLESRQRRFRAFVAGLTGAIHRLLNRIDREQSETHGDAGLQRDLLKRMACGAEKVST